MKRHLYRTRHNDIKTGKIIETEWAITARANHHYRMMETAFVTHFWRDGVRILGGKRWHNTHLRSEPARDLRGGGAMVEILSVK